MTVRRTTRGQPLVALVVLLGSWVAARAMLWDTAAFTSMVMSQPLPSARHAAEAGRRLVAPAAHAAWPEAPPARSAQAMQELVELATAAPRLAPSDHAPLSYGLAAPRQANGSGQDAAAPQMVWLDASAPAPLPANFSTVQPSEPAVASFHAVGHEAPHQRRWSADGWLFLRRGGHVSLATGVAPSTYGASQAGAVLRYRIAPASGHRPAAFLRATAALNGSQEREVAVGLSARPLAPVPVVAAAELRATHQTGRTRLRPAATLVTELAPFHFPFETRAEAYAQGGYVGGEFSTAFVDGQLRIDRAFVHLGKAELRAGGGAWGGAQKGASRLDFGPAATLGLPVGKSASARLALDWRFRVAGHAAPSSGPALTLSAGF